MTKFNKILVTGFSQSNLDENVWAKIRELADEVVFEFTPDADCLLSRFNKIDKEFINSLPQLKYIGILATGSATVDYEYANSKGIVVSNIPGYATESVAEFTFAIILENLRNLKKAKQVARDGDFSGDGFSATEIKGKTFGIIGMGRIGVRVAEIAMAFGAKVVYWSRSRKEEIEAKGAKYESLDNVVSKSDFLSLHLNRVKELEGIIDEQQIKSLKSGMVFINVAPMELINLTALENQLKEGDITFIFDHPDEMNPEDVTKLSQYKNCVVYPPIGFVTKEARVLKQDIFVANIENFLREKASNRVS
ncbi:MAG: hypothetical protein COZ34_04030 [Candidatus Pacebacteria bacterium CG_4_10_14_3_um_filter_34_15]|nr:hypothetical protein [Candidatus Pacearchaeota archaeon]NCQ65804.1 hypothetical protein [Candidatus Paceibacterota bacterium]OIO44502.1 MAG: hypothetical protein AUJ41_02530 [Candidatus Pacebacteria bacterium CG1_02_43_31]PIQ80615.1 MAG: hypothetical protein COV78_04605 [Candidatus Pacebacteria bacterium CG11_big_fil_rev_8_21_14_0_20_34_55]PIX81293.1 MAG: hypothetical protein COZ34_04030 [Candidatus Pacebacteria bacterium CG_4_10_14_3_um_filter_34_15]PJC43456.1 MAG: hypothetical protein CO0